MEIEVLDLYEDNDKQENKKHNKKVGKTVIKVIIYIILFAILLSLLFLIYTKHTNKEKKVVRSELSVKNKEVTDLYDKVKLNKDEDERFSKFNNKSKLYLAYRNISKDKYIKSTCSLFSEVKLKKSDALYKCISDEKNSFTKKQLEDEYYKLFGNKDVDHQTIIMNDKVLKYIKSSNIYIIGEYMGGKDNIIEVKKELSKAYRENNTLYILEKVIYLNKETGSKITSDTYTSGTYKYTFVKKKGTYIYTNKELVE